MVASGIQVSSIPKSVPNLPQIKKLYWLLQGAKVDSRLRGSRFEQKLQFYALFTENWIIISSREAEIAESEVSLFCSQQKGQIIEVSVQIFTSLNPSPGKPF